MFCMCDCCNTSEDRQLIVRDRADVVTRSHCCVDCCVLNGLGYEKGKQILYDIMISRYSMTREEKKNDMRQTVRVRKSYYYYFCSAIITSSIRFFVTMTDCIVCCTGMYHKS